MAEGFASFKTGKGMYVSTKKFKSHAEVAVWVAAELKSNGLASGDIRGKPAWPVGSNGK